MKKNQGRMWMGAVMVCVATSACTAQEVRPGQDRPGQDQGGRGPMPMREPGPPGDRHGPAAIAARQARLHDDLKLDASQEAAWKELMAAMSPEQSGPPPRERLDQLSAPERMERMLAMMKEREAVMASHLAAVKKFYAALRPEQRKIFDAGFGPGSHPGHGPAAEHRHGKDPLPQPSRP